MAAEIAQQHGVRYLVNNAGANRPGPLETATPEDMDYVMALTVRAAMILIKAFVPGMREAKFGRIVSMASRAMMGKTQRMVYSAAKAALVGMTRSTCLEVAGGRHHDERSGAGAGGIGVVRQRPSARQRKASAGDRQHSGKARGTPDDIARMVAFLLAAENGYITGQTIFVCGGTSISGTGGQ